MEFKQYPSYKPSGVEWLGDVPEHWQIVRTKDIFNHRKEEALEDDEIVTAFRDGQVTLRKNRRTDGFTNSIKEHGYQHINSGDLVIHEMDAFAGAIGVSDSSGKSTPVYSVCYAKNENINHHFYSHFFRTMAKTGFINSLAKGIRVRSTEFRWNESRNVYLVEPPKSDQQKIIAFLDTETTRIDNLIAKQEKLIELFKENIIALAMSEQINGKGKLIRLCNIVEEIHRPTQLIETEEYVALGLYNRGRGLFHKPSTLGQDMGDSDFFYVNSGDLILSGQFAWEGAVAMASNTECGCVVSHRYPVLRGSLVNTEYLFALFMTDYGDYLLNDSSRGSAGRNKPLNTNILLKHKIRMPSKEVQEKIKTMLEQKLKLEIKVHEVIEKLKEYRSSIISHAVTGKIDVREFC